MPTPSEPISPSSHSRSSQRQSTQQNVYTTATGTAKRSTSTRLSQKIRSLRHLRLGGSSGNSEEEGKKQDPQEPQFRIVHTPDRPSRLVSPLEAPTEEQCFDEIKGWHSAAAAAVGERKTSPEPEQESGSGLPLLPPVEVEGQGLGLGLGLGLGIGWDIETGKEQQRREQELDYMPENTGRGNFFEAQGIGQVPAHGGDTDTSTENIDISSGKGKEILQPRVYYPRRDSFVSVSVASSSSEDDNGEEEWDKNNNTKGKEIEPWESRSPPAPPILEHEKLAPLFSYSPPSATNSSEKLQSQLQSQGATRSDTDTPEEQFKLELDDESLPGVGIAGEERPPHEIAQMQQLWSHLRKVKSQGGGGATGTGTGEGIPGTGSSRASGFSCFSSGGGRSNDGYAYSHDGEIHTAQVVNLELRRNMERFREGWCPYCGKRIEENDRGESHCRRCFADLRGVKGLQTQAQAVNTVVSQPQQQTAYYQKRPDRGYDAGRPFVTSGSSERKPSPSPSTSPKPPKPLRERAILEQGLDGGSRKGSSNDLRGKASQGTGDLIYRTNSAPPNTGRGPYSSDISYKNNMVPSKPQPVPQGTLRNERPPESSKFSYTSSYASSSSSSLSQPKSKPPPRLADRPVLQDAAQKPSTLSLTQQLRQRPPPPPPERVVYAKDIKQKKGKPPHNQQQTPSNTSKKTVVSPNLDKQQPTPSPLRHEIKEGSTAARKQEAHYSGPLLPATVYRPLPPPPAPPPAAPQPNTRPPSRRPLPFNSKATPLLPRSVLSPGFVLPASPGITSTSRPNQSRPLNPEQLQPVPHQPNHPAPLRDQSLAPVRPSPPLPGPPPPRPSLMPAASLTAIGIPPAQPRQDSPLLLRQTRYQPQSQPAPPSQTAPSGPIMPITPNIRPTRPPLDFKPGLPSKPNSNLLSSALEQARTVNTTTANPKNQSPLSASSSNYSPYGEDSPNTNSTSTFPSNTNTSTASNSTLDSRTPTGAPQIPLSTISTISTLSTSTSESNLSNPFATPPMSNSQFQPQDQTQTQGQGQGQGHGGVKNVEITPSSAQVPVFRYDSWMTPEYKAEYERLIAENGDNADLYMDIFDDYTAEDEVVDKGKESANVDSQRGVNNKQDDVGLGIGIRNDTAKRVAWDVNIGGGGDGVGRSGGRQEGTQGRRYF